MSAFPQVIADIARGPQPSPVGLNAQELQKNALAVQQGQQNIESGAVDLEIKKRQLAQTDALNKAFQAAMPQQARDPMTPPTGPINQPQPSASPMTPPTGPIAQGAQPAPQPAKAPRFNWDNVYQSLANSGQGSLIPKLQEHALTLDKMSAEVQEKNDAHITAASDYLGATGKAIKDSGNNPTIAGTLLAHAAILYPDEAHRAMAFLNQNPDKLPQLAAELISLSPAQQKMANERGVAQIRANTPEARTLNDFLQNTPKGYEASPLGFQKYKNDQEVQKHVAEETNPAVIQAKVFQDEQRAKAEMAIKNGSAEDAGKMLAQGLIAPSEIAQRSNPSFLVYANKAALKYDPSYNAQKAEADFNVAKSSANSPFFGSAKSLTDKGGTLDQLEAAAKDIPNGQIPAFNSLADWEKAASGSGPIARYASVALGVADDYSKVMGGGAGSDTSRTQALKLIGASQSPDQRHNAVLGIRGAVGSQINSRIGNNKVLRNMYGQDAGAAPAGGGAAPKVGDVVTVRGQRVKITAIDASGNAQGVPTP